MAVATLVSVEEYLSTIYHPDCDYVDGEVIERNMGESDHAGVQMGLAALLYQWRSKLGIHIFPELRVQVGPRRFRVPDLLVTTHKVPRGVLREAPALCVEVLSPEDRMSRVEARISDFLEMGVPTVWMIDPRRRKGWIYTTTGRVEAVENLTCSNPALAISLGELFTALDDDVEG